MAIENVKQLKTVNGITQAQGLLDQGWIILAVCGHAGKPRRPHREQARSYS